MTDKVYAVMGGYEHSQYLHSIWDDIIYARVGLQKCRESEEDYDEYDSNPPGWIEEYDMNSDRGKIVK